MERERRTVAGSATPAAPRFPSPQSPLLAPFTGALLPAPLPAWECSICGDGVQQEPVLTPCGHSFCRACIVRVLRENSDSSGRCPMCRARVPANGQLLANERLQRDLSQHSLECGNTGCEQPPICASVWRAHQEECAFSAVSCQHAALGCKWSGVRHSLKLHLEICAFHAMRAHVASTIQELKQLRHVCSHFETALAHAGQQITQARQWRNGNLIHALQFLWSAFIEPAAHNHAAKPLWRHCLDVTFLQTLLLAFPLLAVHHGMLTGALPAATACRPFHSALLWCRLRVDRFEQLCTVEGSLPHLLAHAVLLLLFLRAVVRDGWARPVRQLMLARPRILMLLDRNGASAPRSWASSATPPLSRPRCWIIRCWASPCYASSAFSLLLTRSRGPTTSSPSCSSAGWQRCVLARTPLSASFSAQLWASS